MKISFGLLVLFGSGETGAAGRAIHRKIFQFLGKRDQRVAVLETPAGFQPNSEIVANEVADVFRKSLGEFVSNVSVIPARRKRVEIATPRRGGLPPEADRRNDTTDNPQILEPLKKASYIFLGPGSPTYAKKQLENSLALRMILDRWKNGAVLSLSSAAALAAGDYTLPVYEIYKAGSDLYWENGLKLTGHIGLNLTIITHWNNREGGKDLDTSRCFMGKDRFSRLLNLLPAGEKVLGIDEHTAMVIDSNAGVLTVWGKGSGRQVIGEREAELKNGVVYKLESLRLGLAEKAEINFQEHFLAAAAERIEKIEIGEADLDEEILMLVRKRKIARDNGLFNEADGIRKSLLKLGYEVRDEKSGQKVYIN